MGIKIRSLIKSGVSPLTWLKITMLVMCLSPRPEGNDVPELRLSECRAVLADPGTSSHSCCANAVNEMQG